MSGTVAKDKSGSNPGEWSANLLRSVRFVLRYIVTVFLFITLTLTIVVFGHELTISQSIAIGVLGILYLAWTLSRSQPLVDAKFESAEIKPRVPATKVLAYFAVQLALVESIIAVTRGTQAVLLLWLILLPSACHATIFLRFWGILSVATLCAMINAMGMVAALGLQTLPSSLSRFGIWFGFVVGVTALSVRAVKTKQEAMRLMAELDLANHRLRKFAIQSEELAATRERYRLARQIHDTIGHALTVANVQLEVAWMMIDQDPETARNAIGKSQTVVREGLQEIREAVSELRSSPIENRSLVEAFQRIVMEFETVECPIEFEVKGNTRNLPEKAHLCLFRAGQECVTNAKRHASATRIALVIDYSVAETVSLTVSDNGNGSDELQEGFGLIGIRERTEDVGGSVRITTAAGWGFEIEIKVPG